ncbi:hypothetical protein ACF07M_12275 [Streptomyces globisporus]|uniref:hypothetical protein n=2 Tax=Streptomyces TaxID=1883 RepID=UPI0036FD96E8
MSSTSISTSGYRTSPTRTRSSSPWWTGNVLGNCYTSAEVDHAIRDTQRFTDRSKAMQRFRAVQDTIAKDAPLIPVRHKQRHVVTRSTVLGGHLLAEDAVWRLWEPRRL